MKNRPSTRPDITYDRPTPPPLHHLGQNFLCDRHMARRIVGTIPEDTETVIEIGPGTGILTDYILERGFRVIAYEIDPRFHTLLKDRFRDHPNIEVLNRNILEVFDEDTMGPGNYLVSNLPFNISSAMIGKILEHTMYPFEEGYRFCGATLMFQKEFAERLLASSGSRSYGRLSISFQSKLHGRIIERVPRECFSPRPEVDASVVLIGPLNGPTTEINDTALFERLVKVSFAGRRKKLKNTLSEGSLSLKGGKSSVIEIMGSIGVSTKRPEELSIEDFVRLSNEISVHRKDND